MQFCCTNGVPIKYIPVATSTKVLVQGRKTRPKKEWHRKKYFFHHQVLNEYGMQDSIMLFLGNKVGSVGREIEQQYGFSEEFLI